MSFWRGLCCYFAGVSAAFLFLCHRSGQESSMRSTQYSENILEKLEDSLVKG
jgi:hypothetical protein